MLWGVGYHSGVSRWCSAGISVNYFLESHIATLHLGFRDADRSMPGQTATGSHRTMKPSCGLQAGRLLLRYCLKG